MSIVQVSVQLPETDARSWTSPGAVSSLLLHPMSANPITRTAMLASVINKPVLIIGGLLLS